ncbi:uncharacterized protein LOC124344000 [Daphnia pulicaria]|uniref:uncharacterized protein LOC124344000 n=1 Tax=Daphnia pulicaria TaxID=35523 RepID=UPI001EEABBB3|nr:uncharacterized protein LOC124344000 [Daphnia pulicaria]XP_046653347.1 uncharacterized protein LOC124344000 [Daphnia pulicaria]
MTKLCRTICQVTVFLYFCVFASATDTTRTSDLYAYFSQHGIKGSVKIMHNVKETDPENLNNTKGTFIFEMDSHMDVEPASYSWSLYDLPVEYTQPVACDKGYLGEKILDLTPLFGQVTLPNLNFTVDFNLSLINVTGPTSLWGRTLIFEGPNTLCATIMPEDGLKVAAARLSSPIAGSVTVISWSVGDEVDTRVLTDLYHVSGDGTASNHVWKLLVTDVLDTKQDRDRGDCNALQFLYDPDSRSGVNCSPQAPQNCKQGDLSGRLGLVRSASKPGGGFGGGSRRAFRDPLLVLPDLKGPRSLYMVLFDKDLPDVVLACGRFRELRPRKARAFFAQKGVRGEIVLEQRTPIDPTHVLVNVTGLNSLAGGFHIHEYPVPIPRVPGEKICSATANHYNPWGWVPADSPPPGRGTGEMYELGDLSGKFGMLTGLTTLENDVTDTTLPLFGPYSVQGRGLVIHLASDGSRWVCTNVEPFGVKMTTAVAIFRYPLGGRIFLRQASEDPLSETMVYIESLIYSDGNVNGTNNHQLEIHTNLPGVDFHDWQLRCQSTGSIYNPFKINEKNARDCNTDTQRRCIVGDLTMKHGRLVVAGLASEVKTTQRLFTDVNLPLSGPQSIIGRSVVIFDDNSPKQRGNRLACTPIMYYHRHKTVVKDWFGNGLTTPVEGKVEIIQETEFSSSSIQMDLTGLRGEAGRYGIYSAPVKVDLQFPCTESSLGMPHNPLNVSLVSDVQAGTSDQYPVGDLSSKFGQLAGFSVIHSVFNDTNMPLYGATSIIGRSFVLNRARDNERWACGTMGWGFSPSEATEIRAIASFHHPGGFLTGYVRMSQVVYHDGSATDTVIEVFLRHPGRQNTRNLLTVTRNHRWAVYVNPVGVDAAVAPYNARCVASGYMWNPSFVQLTAPVVADQRNEDVYRQECQPHVPYRCMIGDLSGRLGPIDIGAGRTVFSDKNLPLHGKYSVLGRSLIVFTPDGGGERFACANIEPDGDIFKFIVIRKPRKFVASEFVEDVRRVLGVPEWMLLVDTRHTRNIQNDRCVQFKVHFYGPVATRIEQDLSQLLSRGQLDSPTIQVHGSHVDPKRSKTIPYHVCDESDNAQRQPSSDTSVASSISFAAVLLALTIPLTVFT